MLEQLLLQTFFQMASHRRIPKKKKKKNSKKLESSRQFPTFLVLFPLVCLSVAIYFFVIRTAEKVPENISGADLKHHTTTNEFNPIYWRMSYYAGINRKGAQKLLGEPGVSIGTFLITDSSRFGEYSLSVREADEGNTVYHYLIERDDEEEGTLGVKIANQSFPHIPALLNHFKTRVLTKASLLSAYRLTINGVVTGTFKFTGERETDLPFEQGERLEILAKTNNDWWEARNALGTTGLVPANYVTVQAGEFVNDRISKGASQSSIGSSGNGAERFSSTSTNSDNAETHPRLPAIAKVTFDRVPNAYDPTQLRVKKGQTIRVTQKLTNGMYKAELDGQIGSVPFTYLRFITANE